VERAELELGQLVDRRHPGNPCMAKLYFSGGCHPLLPTIYHDSPNSMTSHDTTHHSYRSRRGEAGDGDREGSRRHRSTSRTISPSRRRHHHHHHHHSTHRKKRTRSPAVAVLPLNATPISSRDLTLLSNVFASYLEVQKNLELHTLSDREEKGRFKSFVSHL